MNINSNLQILSKNSKPLHFGELDDGDNINTKYYSRINSTVLEANRQRYIAGREFEDGYISNRTYKKELKKINKWEQKHLNSIKYEDYHHVKTANISEETTGFISKFLNIFRK